MSSEYITFCGYEHCPDKMCERHMCHIRDFKMLHNPHLAYFDDCSIHKQLVDDLRSTVSDIED